jgi:hypothetical protein
MTSENFVDRFVSCSICLGYCHDSARVETAELFERDLEAIYQMCGANDAERLANLHPLLESANQWVKYYAALTLARHDAIVPAVEVLQSLQNTKQGLPGLFAAAALAHLVKSRGH